MRDIEGFEGLYSITSTGKVWSHHKGIFRKTYSSNYEYIDLWKNGKGHKRSIHRLVAQAFIDNPKNLPDVDHKDDNPFNNDLSNLQWLSTKDNIARSYKTMSPVRNFSNCELYRNTDLIGRFKSVSECSRFCVTLGLSFSTMRKYKKCGEYTINM